MPAQNLPATREINDFLAKGFNDHGYIAKVDGQWVTIEGSPVKLNGHVVEGNRDRDMTILEVHVRLQLPDGRLVRQQVVGWGKDREEAIVHAQASFVLGTFHALVGAFIDPAEEHVERHDITIGGKPRVATFGSVVLKAVAASTQPSERGWQKTFHEALEKSNLSPGAHWIDLYHAQLPKEEMLEIQLDNSRSPDLEAAMKTADWPKGGTLTSVRQFVVIQDTDDATRPKSRPTTRPTMQATTSPTTNPL